LGTRCRAANSTGKERDSESGLDDFEARYFGSSLGRFMSADPDNLTRAFSSSLAYAPFGEQYSQSNPNAGGDAAFTGQGSGFGFDEYDFPARQYSTVGRWVSPDPAGLAAVDPTSPQSWNRYAYVANSPLSNIDPTGLACYPLERAVWGSCAPFMGNGVNLGAAWDEFDILTKILGPDQTTDVGTKINDVPAAETLTYYGGDLSLLNLLNLA
jgi:RHS repeat-associated protein